MLCNNNKRLSKKIITILPIAAIIYIQGLTPQSVGQTLTSNYILNKKIIWDVPLETAGFSSPGLADFNGDGVLDVVIGSGKENSYDPTKVIAINGKNGHILWEKEISFLARVTGTAALVDINQDHVSDVIIGIERNQNIQGLWDIAIGEKKVISPMLEDLFEIRYDEDIKVIEKRIGGIIKKFKLDLTEDLIALNGASGKLLWSLKKRNPHHDFPITNFHVQMVSLDRDGDGLKDIIAIQSGGLDVIRPPARIYLVSSATGKIIQHWESPDKKEVYAYPAFEKKMNDKNYNLFIGTGGEILPGNLIKLDFFSMKEQWRLTEEAGFIASPTLHDFNNNQIRDVIVSSFNGTLYRIGGASGKSLWKVTNPGFETYSSPALGAFNSDSTLDVVALFTQGSFPNYGAYGVKAIMIWVDGKTGELIHKKTFGVAAMSSPLTLDLNNDGYDEVIAVSNLFLGSE